MNDNTVKFLEQLAAKLGTTSEYLWALLLRQAPISATINLVYCILIGLAWIPFLKAHKHFSNDENNINYEDSDTGLPQICMAIIGVLLIIFTICCFLSVSDIINGYFNPEFWAIDYVLGKLNPSK